MSDLRNRCNLQFSKCRPAARWTERLRDSPVLWHCRARWQHIGFKTATALQTCVLRRNLEVSSAARSAPAKFPVRPGVPSEVSEEKNTGFSSKMFGEKSGILQKKSASLSYIMIVNDPKICYFIYAIDLLCNQIVPYLYT